MKIQVKEFVPVDKGQMRGYGIVVWEDMIEIYVRLLKSKAGKDFCSMPSVYLDEKFKDLISFTSKDRQKEFLRMACEAIVEYNDYQEGRVEDQCIREECIPF